MVKGGTAVDGLLKDIRKALEQGNVERYRAQVEPHYRLDLLLRWRDVLGADAAVAALAYRMTGSVRRAQYRAVRDVRVRRVHGGVEAETVDGQRIRPTRLFSAGFEFGYAGSGPNELATSILAHFYGPEAAVENRRPLVEVLASVPLETREFLIPAAVIRRAVGQE